MTESSVDFVALGQRGYRFALALTHDDARAADLVQDAWVAVLTARGSWNAPYLFAAIRSRFVDAYRRDQRRSCESLMEEPAADGADESRLWDGDGSIDVSREELHRALGVLSPEERAALFLAAAEDYSVQQIADVLQRPRGTVLSMMHRARATLREALRSRPRLRA